MFVKVSFFFSKWPENSGVIKNFKEGKWLGIFW